MRYLVILIVSALFLQASAGILPFSVTADVTWNSKYVWRGLPCDEESVLQPSLFLSLTGLTAGVWGNVEMTDVNELTEEDDRMGVFTEIDYYLGYEIDLLLAGVGIGVGYYDYPNTEVESSAELYLTGYAKVPFSPTVTIYQGIKESEGMYVSVSGSQDLCSMSLAPAISMTPALTANLGWGNKVHNNYNFGVDKPAMTDLTLGLAAPVGIGPVVKLTPALHYSMMLDEEIKELYEDDTNFWGGVSLTASI
ncbi:MAG TPA: hypothetical protein PLX54_02245 [Candidatus Fermentibacter daniensis]|jgi:uncharacterized protein (TIGR02001 family)|nr:hypothetical protein [Candidatus Fermentibacter daniensis]HOF65887.1 hypothetical protein [Candidatus Fermentibacter daniensis]HOG54269.1 hypothetical protein [Candidatus Fermentibacter daniensis]HOR06944.1 hypothetical protein [Candidatus Fermentibacter daniensis]HOZ17692.1 hypothetical protein [Candidatus Fermentibacter daniensis]